jgi:hypothetical protein
MRSYAGDPYFVEKAKTLLKERPIPEWIIKKEHCK